VLLVGCFFSAETLELPWLWRCREVILCVGNVRRMHVLGSANVEGSFVMSCVVFVCCVLSG